LAIEGIPVKKEPMDDYRIGSIVVRALVYQSSYESNGWPGHIIGRSLTTWPILSLAVTKIFYGE